MACLCLLYTATGILTGMDGLLNPKGDATRAQIATMLLRYFVAF